MGRVAKRVSEPEAKKHVLGYTCLNDVSERIIQKADGMPCRAKGFDTFTPMGPWIATDVDGDNLKIECFVNSELKQSSNTNMLIFNVSFLVSFISNIMTLYPGDIIASGTPEGVSELRSGDVVDITIEKIGTLRNCVVKRK
jgi:2-keto-4-pentenoate hydratase/2-oxohepta-3-ene-1,7-dioic acid hydratase in catechol pathway